MRRNGEGQAWEECSGALHDKTVRWHGRVSWIEKACDRRELSRRAWEVDNVLYRKYGKKMVDVNVCVVVVVVVESVVVVAERGKVVVGEINKRESI